MHTEAFLPLSSNISSHLCSCLQNDMFHADNILLPKGKLGLKLNLEKAWNSLELAISLFQRDMEDRDF